MKIHKLGYGIMKDTGALPLGYSVLSLGSNSLASVLSLGSICLASCFLLLAGLLSSPVLAQSTPAVGKPLSYTDSVMVKQLFLSALIEKTDDHPEQATELFNKIIQLDPLNDASLYELANIKKTKNNNAEALPLLEKAVAINPGNEWYWVALADCYEKNNDLPKLENVFNKLTAINPDKPDYYYDKANVYFLQKKYDEALQVYNQLEQLAGPSDDLLANRQKIYLKQGKVNLAAAQLEQIIAANPSQIKYYLYLAELYTANNFADKALKVLQTAEKIDAGNGVVHLALADSYRDKKEYEKSYNELTLAFAIADLDIDQKIKIILGYLPKFPAPDAKASALELSRLLTIAHPADAKAFAVYGDMLLQNEKLKDAEAMYKKAISFNNQVYEVQEQLVRIELSSNDLDGAVKDGENSLSLFPNQAWMNYLVGIAWLQKKDYKKAVEYIKNATSLAVQDNELLSQSFATLGDCYHSLNDYKNSDGAYEKALSYNPDNAYTLNNYAYYLSLRGGQLEKAAAMSKHSNELQPNNASFEDTYAWILFKQKDYAGAKLWIEKALAHGNDSGGTKSEHYGDIMFYLGNTDAAIENWKKAKANGNQSPVLERKINEKKYIE